MRQVLGTPIVGMNWDLAQRIPAHSRGAFWLVPANGHLCVVQWGAMRSPGAGASCAPTSEAIEHGIASVTVKRAAPGAHEGQARLIVGVAPDGTQAVLVRTRGSRVAAALAGDVFTLRDSVAAPPDALTLR